MYKFLKQRNNTVAAVLQQNIDFKMLLEILLSGNFLKSIHLNLECVIDSEQLVG